MDDSKQDPLTGNQQVDFLDYEQGIRENAASFSLQTQRQESGFGGEAAKPTRNY